MRLPASPAGDTIQVRWLKFHKSIPVGNYNHFRDCKLTTYKCPGWGSMSTSLLASLLLLAWSVSRANAKTTAKKVICRYGVPEAIESDRGSHFTGELMQNVMQELGVEQEFHTPYHPQSSGKVERLNGTLKLKIQKMRAETVRTVPNKNTKLSPYEILFGGPPQGLISVSSSSTIMVT